jgi:hypothetical protein
MKHFNLVTKVKPVDGKFDKKLAQSKFENDCKVLIGLGFELQLEDLDGSDISETTKILKLRCRIVEFPANTFLCRNEENGTMILMRVENSEIHTPLVRFKFIIQGVFFTLKQALASQSLLVSHQPVFSKYIILISCDDPILRHHSMIWNDDL